MSAVGILLKISKGDAVGVIPQNHDLLIRRKARMRRGPGKSGIMDAVTRHPRQTPDSPGQL